jgi:hypothetical protein
VHAWIAAFGMLLCASVWAGAPGARPKLTSRVDPDVVQLWDAAARETDPERAAGAWRIAAEALDRAAVGAGTPAPPDLTFAAVLAWNNARTVRPAGLPASLRFEIDTGMLHAIDRALPVSIASTRPRLLFLRGTTLHGQGDWDGAAVALAEVVFTFPEHVDAESSAYLLLDALGHAHQTDAVATSVIKMRATPKLLAGRRELAATLVAVHVQILKASAEAFAQDGTNDRAAYARCADAYLAALAIEPTVANRAELLYNAGVCFAEAGHRAAAIQRLEEVVKQFPRSPLVAPARDRARQLRGDAAAPGK